jgi:hypothetical protein
MSIYNVLSIDTPIIGYSVFHQAKKGIPAREYKKALMGLHQSIAEESNKIQEVWKNYTNDLKAKAIQTTHGSLAQFLSTPLQSDMQEINRIIGEQLQQITQQMLEPVSFGLIGSIEQKFVFETCTNPHIRKYLLEGKRLLRTFHFNITASSEIYDSTYFIKGGQNLDLLEHIIRDRIGVYNSQHGKHIQQAHSGTYSITNLKMIKGELLNQSHKFELTLHFSKHKVTYKDLDQRLANILNELNLNQQHIDFSIWQRKLGLGILPEFTLCISSKEKNILRDVSIDLLKNLYVINKKKAFMTPEYIFIKECIF